MATQLQLVTAEELLEMPDDGVRRELIRGEIREMSPAGDRHGDVGMQLGWRLGHHVSVNSLGKVYLAETGFKLASDPDTVRAPDIAFVRRERVEREGTVLGFRTGAPDLAVEVISPSDRFTAVEDKVFEWLDAGARMVIVLNPEQRTATVYRSRQDIVVLTERDRIDGADVVPGWTVAVSDLFG